MVVSVNMKSEYILMSIKYIASYLIKLGYHIISALNGLYAARQTRRVSIVTDIAIAYRPGKVDLQFIIGAFSKKHAGWRSGIFHF